MSSTGAPDRLWLYDLPLWKDWLVYLTALGVLAGLVSGGGFIDLAFAVAFQFLLFGVVPGSIRVWWRSRH